MKKIIATPNAPSAIGPYSQAVLSKGWLYLSGQIAINPETGALSNQSIAEETHQVLKNASAVIEAADMSLDHVVKVTIFLRSMDDYAAVNEVYAEYFTNEPPAREPVEVSRLPKNVNIEISMIAAE
jgi:2-iminobutanoate/2-iminopropanoate deaminase